MRLDDKWRYFGWAWLLGEYLRPCYHFHLPSTLKSSSTILHFPASSSHPCLPSKPSFLSFFFQLFLSSYLSFSFLLSLHSFCLFSFPPLPCVPYPFPPASSPSFFYSFLQFSLPNIFSLLFLPSLHSSFPCSYSILSRFPFQLPRIFSPSFLSFVHHFSLPLIFLPFPSLPFSA